MPLRNSRIAAVMVLSLFAGPIFLQKAAGSPHAAPLSPPDPAIIIPPALSDLPPAGTASAPAARHPALGVNLEGVNDFSRSMVFVDAMKAARGFGAADKPWEGKAPVDKDGWPTTDAGCIVMTNVPVEAGNYVFSCIGRCELSAPVTDARVTSIGYDRKQNLTRAVVTVEHETDHLYLSFKNTKGGIKDIRLIRPGYTGNTKQVFTREFLKAIEPFSTLRCMDFTQTNSTDVAEWDERPKVTDARQSTSRGVAWEYCIELANTAHKDLWINVPDRATDDYVRKLAELLKEKLDPERLVYVEYSNEVWNGIFPQGGRNLKAAEEEVAQGNTLLTDGGTDSNKYYWAWKRVSERIVHISGIFRSVFGDGAMMTRIRPVLASQSANTFMTRMQVEFIADHYGPPAKFIWGIAGAPYLDPDKAVVERDGLTVGQLLEEGFAHSITGWFESCTLQYQTIATYYHLHSMCYEGGISLGGDKNLAVKIAANKDPRIEKITKAYLNQWYAQGGDLFMYYCLCGSYSKWGCWGLTDDIRRAEPKMKGAMAVAREEMPALAAGAAVPGRIAAADFETNQGGDKVDDGAGGKCLGYLREGATFDYLLRVEKAGDYEMSLETASPSDGAEVELLFDGTLAGTIACKGTGGWTKWGESGGVRVHLPAGQLVLRVRVKRAGVNVRGVEIR